MTSRLDGLLRCLLGAAVGIAAVAPAGAQAGTHAEGHAAAVDPRIGTGGDGHTFPGATVPFGMIQLSPGHRDAGLQARLQVGRRLPVRRQQHPGLLAHALLRLRPFGPGRRAGDADRRRGAAGAGRPGQAGQRLPLALLARQRSGAGRLLRGDAERLRRARRADRRTPRSAGIATPSRRASRRTCCSTCARASTTTPARCCGRACACVRTAPSPAAATRAAGRRGASCISPCASRSR